MSIKDDHANPFSLAGKVAVVTGGASGIGFAIARQFAASGASLRLLDLDEAAAQVAAREIVDNGGEAVGFGCDVSDTAQVQQVFEKLIPQGPLDILVNNAGVSHVGNLETTTEAEFDRVFAVNVRGVFHCLQAAIRTMKDTGGIILNLASIAGSVGLANRFAYSMSKGAVIAMTLSVARDYLKRNIRCNCISPARVHTPLVDGYLTKYYSGKEEETFRELSAAQPIGRMAKPEEVAYLALFLCSEQAGFITGVDYPLDGGFLNLRG